MKPAKAANDTKFTPINDEDFAEMSEAEKIMALGGIHLAWMSIYFREQVDQQMRAGFAAAVEQGKPLSDVVVVLADRKDEFFKTHWTEEVKSMPQRVNAWWVFKDTLRAMTSIYDDPTHKAHVQWVQACSISEYGLNCIVIAGTGVSVQFIQPMPEKSEKKEE